MSQPIRHSRVARLVSGPRHSRITVVVAVAHLATTLYSCHNLLPLPGLTILTGTRMPGWMTLNTRVRLFASLTATATLVVALSLSALRRRLFAGLNRVVHLHLLVLSRVDALSRVRINPR